ncbi:DNA-binding domain-containing protein [Rhodoplanes sp. TEM]|uniref:DNA-binding domain-containing protein n=1 Tax=Rhodoplanes tepidamans TaxID=200616 RepID=A0ABT5JBN9_RHOTP|nr:MULTISPECIES: DNA-binding domain-containing protein [Rhodoplanes]MDC7787089.1 DNA-binding domain-containing protein [Rhodoplanes tepidamans]MDC7986318.1 DNA-binding domain-containing protein [Rhodoplanes sp. TEM]MDQ0358689.1 hypothetical protein [Rhodoplanes tepidamans]
MSGAPFAAALLDPGRPLPVEITSHTARHPERRFAVYRNNVTASLIEALRARFPATEQIVGEDFFAATARDFVRAHPPRSPLLMRYGDGFPAFLEHFPPAAGMPWLADVARLEAARTRAYHAADAVPLGPSDFAAIDPATLGTLRVALHPSAAIVRSPFPVVTIWAMNSGTAALGPVDFDTPEDALVLRPHLDVTVTRLPPGAAAFLAALRADAAIADAAVAALADDAGFDPTAALALLIGSGLATAVTPAPEASP